MYSPGHSRERDFDVLLRDGVTAVKIGSRRLAQSLLNQATMLNPLDARPWLWLTETTDDPAEKQAYLEKAVSANPGNAAARRGLAVLTGKLDPSSMLSLGESVQVQESAQPEDAQAKETFLCPQCGAHMEFDIHANELVCRSCGHVFETEERSAADREQVMDFVLPTERGHRWAVSQQQFSCQQCGASSLWPPGQKAIRCPYCGSGHLIESRETAELVNPQAIGIMQIDEDEATHRSAEWLGRGWTTPDDLKESSKKTLLRPAYYPFWTFDGTLDMHWFCEVNEGSSDSPDWIMRKGVIFELFDDVLISGLQRVKSKDVKDLEPFNLKDVIEFEPEYLAGWPALTYDRSLAKASLLAREQVMRKVRHSLYSRVLPGRSKRNLTTGAVHWSDMTFKHILLPVWLGIYRYQGKEYKIMVNGQTGKIGGEKPRDMLKTIAIIVSVALSIFVLLSFLVILALNLGWISLP